MNGRRKGLNKKCIMNTGKLSEHSTWLKKKLKPDRSDVDILFEVLTS